ncbi:hypothetical protein [Klebsiella pneumoniae]|uniref:hypothetical protein n=1 Tax=Klebsiella pneumoniae TaxID=573 RepID=UPI001561E703|nr:hypothetical protein [Klebsiella pneumoniae]
MQLHKIPGNIRLRQELPERGIVGVGVLFSSSSALALKNDPGMLSQQEQHIMASQMMMYFFP